MLSSSDHLLRGGAPGLYQQVDTTDQNQDPSLYDGPRGSSLGGEEGHDRSIKNSEYSKIQNEEAISCQQQEFSLRDISRDKKILLLMMAVCNFCAAANFSILGPFFPQEVSVEWWISDAESREITHELSNSKNCLIGVLIWYYNSSYINEGNKSKCCLPVCSN